MAQRLLFIFMLLSPCISSALPIYLPEDELALPPLFSQIASESGAPGDGLNIVSSRNQKRHAIKGEWFDYGDQVSLPSSLAMEVIYHEHVKWVAGGVFQGQISKAVWSHNDTSYQIDMRRGWLKAWIAPGSGSPVLRVVTPNEVFEARNATFWLGVQGGKTELYVIQGEVRPLSSEVPYGRQTYLVRDRTGAKAGSREWDPGAVEVHISASFPALGQLMTKAQNDWDSGKSSLIYATFRRQGWRKAHRFRGSTPK